MRTRIKIICSTAAALAATASLLATIPATATSAQSADSPADAGSPPSTVEDFSYPSAASILANKGIRLIRGDGKLVLADCDDNAQQIRVLTKADPSVNRAGTYCFAAKASSGYLSLELPRVFYFETTDRPISADLTADGKTTTVDVAKDSFKPVGEGVVNGAHSTLVELRVTG